MTDNSTNDPAGCLASLKATQRLCREATRERLDSHSTRLIKIEETLRGRNGNAGLVGEVIAAKNSVEGLEEKMKEAIEEFKSDSQATRTVIVRWMGTLLVALIVVIISNFVR